MRVKIDSKLISPSNLNHMNNAVNFKINRCVNGIHSYVSYVFDRIKNNFVAGHYVGILDEDDSEDGCNDLMIFSIRHISC